MMSSRRSIAPDIDDVELSALLQLRMLPSLRDERLKALVSRYPATLVVSNPALLPEKAAAALRAPRIQRRVDLALRMLERDDVAVVSVRSAAYPENLRVLGEYAPAMVFLRGDVSLLKTRALSIVGARNSTEYGDSVAELLATDLVRSGVTIVSGLALGIDGVAHRAALAQCGGTIGVLGCGIDVHYPHAHYELQERVAQEGLLVSEFAPGDGAHRHHFPQRNRLIAALGSGVIVVEAGPKSGTRKTVDWALQYGIPVFAVPGPIGRYESQGTNEIIRDGGELITSAYDVLETLGWSSRPTETAPESVPTVADPAAARVLQALEGTPLSIDQIARRCAGSAREILTLLFELELDGHVLQHAGKRFSRVIGTARATRGN